MEERLYETDSWLRVLDTEVIEAGEEEGRPWVRLAATLFYPEGGGQPADHGSLGPARVLDVQRREDAIHHLLDRPLPPGPVRAELDWARRFDHMQQHTGQHLLTAVCDRRHGWATLSFHLGETYASIDLDTREADEAELQEVEDEANEHIRAARRVRAFTVPREKLAGLDVRTRGLADHVGESIRLVEIEGLDLNTCGGTHAGSTAELQMCRVLGTEKVRGGVRLRFAFGHRVLALLRAAAAREAALKEVLGASPETFAEVAAGWDRDRRELARTLERTATELAEALAPTLAATPEPVAIRHFAGRDATFLRTLARRVLAGAPAKTLVLFGDDGEAAFFLVTAGEASGRDVPALGALVQAALGGKGGGRGTHYQGRGPDARRIPAALEAARNAVA